MEWAKGLKDRVERTATGLSTAATTAFTPPDEEAGTATTSSLGEAAAAGAASDTAAAAEGAGPSSSSAQGTAAVVLVWFFSCPADEDFRVWVQGKHVWLSAKKNVAEPCRFPFHLVRSLHAEQLQCW